MRYADQAIQHLLHAHQISILRPTHSPSDIRFLEPSIPTRHITSLPGQYLGIGIAPEHSAILIWYKTYKMAPTRPKPRREQDHLATAQCRSWPATRLIPRISLNQCGVSGGLIMGTSGGFVPGCHNIIIDGIYTTYIYEQLPRFRSAYPSVHVGYVL